MVRIDHSLNPEDLGQAIERFWHLSGEKILLMRKNFDPVQGSPVFTADGRYTTRGWTEWTRGFEVGSSLLQYEATGGDVFLEYGRERVRRDMADHLSHTGVHDHGFNNISTNL